MTISQVLNIYEVSFVEIVAQRGMSPTRIFLGGGEMETFFFFFRGPDSIEEDIIPVVDHYMNGNPFPIDNDLTVGGGEFVEVYPDGVRFINRETLLVDKVVPLDHFKIIAQAWADYNKNTPMA